MSYLISTILLAIFISSLLVPTTFSADPLYSICAKDSISHATYTTTLDVLLHDLYNNTPKTGFLKSSSWNGHVKVFGIALCRGDNISTEDCGACLRNASTQIQQSCPESREAVIWYDYCQLKYSDHEFFGEIDTQFQVDLANTKYEKNPQVFNKTVTSTLLKISMEASKTTKRFARADGVKLTNNESAKLYRMAQCTWDLSQYDCYECLVDAVESLPGYSAPAKGQKYNVPRGARILTPNCIVRYETYGFLFYDY